MGKTKLGRILAAELQGTFTVIVVEPEVLTAAEALYQEIERLGPTLVILEDIDAVATKTKRQSGVFSEFLSALDGARVRDGTLTLATANDPGSLDPAVKRPGRFDSIVEIPLPDAAARQKILRPTSPTTEPTSTRPRSPLPWPASPELTSVKWSDGASWNTAAPI